MQLSQPRSRVRLRLLPVLLGLMLLAAACAPSTPPPPLSTSAPPAASAPATSAAPQPTGALNLQTGVDAEGNFYRGDPNAPIKLVEYSDFQ